MSRRPARVSVNSGRLRLTGEDDALPLPPRSASSRKSSLLTASDGLFLNAADNQQVTSSTAYTKPLLWRAAAARRCKTASLSSSNSSGTSNKTSDSSSSSQSPFANRGPADLDEEGRRGRRRGRRRTRKKGDIKVYHESVGKLL